VTVSPSIPPAARPALRGASRIAVFVISSLLALGGARAADADASDAKAFLRAFSDRAIAMLADDGLTDRERAREFRDLLQDGFDMPLISRAVLGRYWHTASAEQREEFVQRFEDFVVSFYGHRLGAYSGETLKLGAAHVRAKDALVRSRVVRPKGPPLAVDWRLRRSGDDWRIVDVVVEGVSMTITHRSEFAAVIENHGGGVESLLQALRNKTATAELGT